MHTWPANLPTRSARLISFIAAVAVVLSWPAPTVIAAALDTRDWQLSIPRGPVVAQDSDASDRTGVSADQIEKYVAVYRAMQLDRGLTAESAAAKQSLTLSQFRELEQKIERDEVAREQVRRELQAAANPSPSATATATPPKH